MNQKYLAMLGNKGITVVINWFFKKILSMKIEAIELLFNLEIYLDFWVSIRNNWFCKSVKIIDKKINFAFQLIQRKTSIKIKLNEKKIWSLLIKSITICWIFSSSEQISNLIVFLKINISINYLNMIIDLLNI